jgi:hypothetical protein
MRSIFCLLIASILLISCGSEYGNKITINKYSEVFYKGKNVTEDDARKLGDFLLKEGYFDSTTNKSVQLTKDSAWVVKLVIDEKKYDPSDANVILGLHVLQLMMSEQVFNKEKTRVVLANEHMEEIKTKEDNDSTDLQ